MDLDKALNIFNINERPITHKLIKFYYRKLAMKFHPDRNPSGLVNMQEINSAYDYLNETPIQMFNAWCLRQDKIKEKEIELALFEKVGLSIFKREGKTWIAGKTYEYREQLKERGFRWNPDEKKWWRYI